MTPEQVREFALALPETEEKGHFGTPDFRTRNKIFCTLREEEGTAVLKLPLEDQEAVTTLQPDVFSLGGWSHQGWPKVVLAKIDAGEFNALLVLAWKKLATKRAIKAYEIDGSGTP